MFPPWIKLEWLLLCHRSKEVDYIIFITLFGQWCFIVWKQLIFILPFNRQTFCAQNSSPNIATRPFSHKKCLFSLNIVMELWFFDGNLVFFVQDNVHLRHIGHTASIIQRLQVNSMRIESIEFTVSNKNRIWRNKIKSNHRIGTIHATLNVYPIHF